ncbi:beta-glucuronidase [Candidatus Aerophobetes bacterium Ae_b3a]|nr:MAG: beta-glucuronidase [Candidatus Aerophobetes bacterium Ae_b3a]
MLYPKMNGFREVIGLSGFFDFKLDPDNVGEEENWQKGVESSRSIGIPGSWNEQFIDTRDYLGPTWHFKKFYVPSSWKEKLVWFRIGAANYYAKVWINGKFIGEHEGGYLPFQFEVTDKVTFGKENFLSVKVDNQLSPERVPPGNIPEEEHPRSVRQRSYPDVNFDFFPYGGIHRPVYLFCTPLDYIEDIAVTTSIEGKKGLIKYRITKKGGEAKEAFIHLGDENTRLDQKTEFRGNMAEGQLTIDEATFWSPDNPHLYEMVVELLSPEGAPNDEYTLSIGIRTIEVKNDRLYLNGEPIFLKGFGKHEDFPIIGKGLSLPLIAKDYSLMKWIGANSFRTSHYPYSEEMMNMADKEGFLVIDEIPAVGLFFGKGNKRRLSLCKQYLRELIARDKNHPSVIMWSIANEPHSTKPEAKEFFRQLYQHTKKLDPSRLVTLVSMFGLKEEALAYVDVICLNRYYGWYTDPGQLDRASHKLSRELDALYQTYKKPILLSEFGAGAIAGVHAHPAELFSEEYQAELIQKYCEVIESKPYMVGEHVWCFADFKTAQVAYRVALNRKGVFTRTRQPKLAAHLLRKIWIE